MRRRGRSEGTIQSRGLNVWRLRVFTGNDAVTGNPRQISRTVHGTKAAALTQMRELIGEVEQGRHAGTNATVGRLFADWLADLARLGKAQSTIDSYNHIVAKHLLPRFGSLRVQLLSAHDLDTYYRDCESRLSPATIGLHHAILSGALAQGVKWGWRRNNPAHDASPPKRPDTSRRAPTTKEVRKLLEAAGEDLDLKTAVLLAVITGGRRGELCGLRWSEVDWDAQELRIEPQRSPTTEKGAGGGPVQDRAGPVKGGKPRVVSIGVLGVAALRSYHAVIEDRAAILGVEMTDDSWLLSYDCGLTPMRSKALTQNVTALGKRAGVPITLHETRHDAATTMVGDNVDVKTAAGRLGHTPEMLLRVDTHRIPERDAAAALLEAGVLGPTGS